MTDRTPRFALPFILPGQAQKELFHNEALVLVDAVLQAAVEEGPRAAPPASAAPGQSWLVAGGAGGAWTDQDGALAVMTEGGWRFVAPHAGMCVWDKAAGVPRQWDGSAWSGGRIACAGLSIAGKTVVGARLPEVPSPSGGTIIDTEARAAVAALIAALKSHGLTE
ncbi:MAG: DUF2793 domain-containing protein [Alphaproteobacteria bacterium]|nr:DUF2793 domain-containing protein [Alphaproteobacteria bacterium]